MSVWSRGPSAVNLQNSRELYTSTAVVGVSCELYLLARRTLDCRPLYLFLHNPVPPAPQLANFCNSRRCILNENNLFAKDFTSRDNKGQLLAACGKLWLLLSHIFFIFRQLLTFFVSSWQTLVAYATYFWHFWQFLATFYNFWQLLAACSKLWLLMPHFFEPRNIFVPPTPPLHLCTSYSYLYLIHLLYIFLPSTHLCTYYTTTLHFLVLRPAITTQHDSDWHKLLMI